MMEKEREELEYELLMRKKLLDFHIQFKEKLNLNNQEYEDLINTLLDEISEILRKLKEKE